MEAYDYNAHVAGDLRDNLKEWFDTNDIDDYSGFFDDLVTDITAYFSTHDGVTGGGSGLHSPWTCTWELEECLCHNMDLFFYAAAEYEINAAERIEEGPESCDVLIRCYVLGQVAHDVVREYVKENYPDFKM